MNYMNTSFCSKSAIHEYTQTHGLAADGHANTQTAGNVQTRATHVGISNTSVFVISTTRVPAASPAAPTLVWSTPLKPLPTSSTHQSSPGGDQSQPR